MTTTSSAPISTHLSRHEQRDLDAGSGSASSPQEFLFFVSDGVADDGRPVQESGPAGAADALIVFGILVERQYFGSEGPTTNA